MSNIRLNTIVPDVLNNPSGIITLPGALSVVSITGTSTLDSLSPTTGSLTLTGGVGIKKSLSIGGNILFSAASGSASTIFQDTIAGTDNKGLVLAGGGSNVAGRGASLELYGNELNSGSALLTSSSTITFRNAGNPSILVAADGTTTLYGTFASTSASTGSLILPSGSLAIGNTTDASSSTSGGALSIAGGTSIAKSLFVGTTATITGAISSSTQTINSTTDSTGLNTGTLVNKGGTSLGKSLYVGGAAIFSSTITSSAPITVNTVTTDTSISSSGGLTLAKNISLGGSITATSGISIGGIFSSTNATDSSLPTNGSAVFAGGVGIGATLRIAGALYTGGTASFTGTSITVSGSYIGTAATDTTALGSGAFVLASGISVAQTARFGGNLFVTGNTSLTGSLTISSALTTSSTVSITNATPSTTPGTGALVLTGGFGLSGQMTTSGIVSITNATVSSSTSTGALQVTGGAGIGGSVNVGNTLSVSGNTTLATTTTGQLTSGLLTVTNTTDALSNGTAGTVLAGGIYVAKSAYIGLNLTVAGTTSLAGSVTNSALTSFTNVTDATNLSTASVVMSGGLSIASQLRVGGYVTLSSGLSSPGVISLTSPTVSTSTTTGALVISGGVGIGGALNVGSTVGITGATTFASTLTGGTSATISITNSADSTSTATGVFFVSGGSVFWKTVRMQSNLYVASSITTAGLASTAPISISDATESTATNTGSMTTAGGLGVAKSIQCGASLTVAGTSTFTGTTTFTSGLDSSAYNVGSVLFSGGVGITKNLNVGGGFSVGAASTFTGTITNTAGNIQLNSTNVQDVSGLLTVQTPAPGFRIAGTAAINATQYANSIDFFTLGSAYTDINHEALQVISTGTTAYTIMSRRGGTGIQRRLLLQSGTNTAQIALNTDGSVSLGSSTNDTTSLTTGSVLIPTGGLAVTNSVSIGKNLQLYGSTSGTMTFTANPTTTSYTLVLPQTLPAASSYALVSDTAGNLSWSQMLTATPTFSSVTATSTAANAISSAGGITATGSFTNGGFDFYLGTADQSTRGNSSTSRALVKYTGSLLVINFNGDFTGGTRVDSTLYVNNSTAATSTTSAALRVGGGAGIAGAVYTGGNINLSGGSGANQVISNTTGIAAPTFTTRSVGTRFVVFPTISSTQVDYAIGVQSMNMWYSAESTSAGHKWYSGTTNTMTLDGTSKLTLGLGGRTVYQGATSGTITLSPPSTITSYTLTLPTAVAPSSNYALVSDGTGTLSWSPMTTTTPSFQTLSLSGTTPTTSLSTGALVVTGGGAFSGNLSVQNSISLYGTTSGSVTLQAPATTASSPVFTLPASLPSTTGMVLASDQAGNMSFLNPSGTSYNFAAANNVTIPTAIPGLSFSSWFKQDVYVQVVGATTLNAMFTLRGYPTTTGYNLFSDYVGDNTSVVFSIDSSGQIYYTSGNVASWSGTTVVWKTPQNFVSPSTPVSFSAANNSSTPASITNLVATGAQFSSYILVRLVSSTAGNSGTTLYLVQGALQPDGTWSVTNAITGPNIGYTFTIAPGGQVQYTSPNTAGWQSTTFQYYPTASVLVNTATYYDLAVTDTADATSSTSAPVKISGGLAVAKSIYKGAAYSPTVSWMQASNFALTAGFQMVSVANMTGNTWLPSVTGGATWSTTFITLPITGLWSLSMNFGGSSTGVGARFTVSSSPAVNGQTLAVSGNTSSSQYIVAESNTGSGTETGFCSTMYLNAGTVLVPWIQSTSTGTVSYLTVTISLVQALS